jgi:gas vesicle protein
MVKGKCKNLTNRTQNHSLSSEPSTPTQPVLDTPTNSDLKSYLMMLVEDIKKGINNSLKEIQENSTKEVEDLKEIQENNAKQVEVLTEETQKSFNPS